MLAIANEAARLADRRRMEDAAEREVEAWWSRATAFFRADFPEYTEQDVVDIILDIDESRRGFYG